MGGGATPAQGFRARAAVLTLMFTGSKITRKELLALLDQTLRGEEEIEVPEPSDMETVWEMIEEDFLFEVADESMLEPDGSVGPNTPLQPSPAGNELLLVMMSLSQWLAARPEGPLELGGPGSGEPVGGVIGGLASTALHLIALAPRTLAELCEAIPEIEEGVHEGQLLLAERAGVIEVEAYEEGDARYGLSEWGRRAIVPVLAAARFEHRHPRGDTLPPDRLDVEAAFAFALPLLALDPLLRGRCRLAVRLPGGGGDTAGAIASVRDGRVASIEAEPGGERGGPVGGGERGGEPVPDTAIADAGAWMEELVGGDPLQREIECEGRLARAIVDALRTQVFAAPGD